MSLAEWNKKEELVTEQATKHLRTYTPLFEAFTTTDRSEMALLLKVQEFCYENMNFMKAFSKIVLLFYKSKHYFLFPLLQLLQHNTLHLRFYLFFSSFAAEVITEDSILKWYKEGHSNKGKMHFLEQMKKFIEWLQNAEEGMCACACYAAFVCGFDCLI